jgi:tetratricopeptide (TPR) repeat protein
MKKILFALLVASGCGSDREVAVDPMSLMPRMPVVAATEPVPSTTVTVSPVAEATPLMPTQFDDALTQGRALAAKGEHDGAKAMFEAAIKLDKHRAEPHIELARLYIAQNERGLAIAQAKKATKLAPLSSQAWNTQGRASLAAFDYDAAIEAFSKSVELDHDNVWAWNNLGYCEIQLKKYDEAVEHLTEATSRKGAAGFMYNNLGTALEQLGKLDEARLAFDAGGKLGSHEALSSRKRLEGVKSVAIAQPDEPKKAEPQAKTFDTNEGTPDPEIEQGSDAVKTDVKADAGDAGDETDEQ